jgi:hypothetical protein
LFIFDGIELPIERQRHGEWYNCADHERIDCRKLFVA